MAEEKAIAELKPGIDIQAVDVRHVESVLRKVAEFQSVVRNTLKEGHDYGIIPGATKPSLLKPGAEKVLMVFGLTSKYEILEAVRDYEGGFFAFTVKCSLEKSGLAVTEGLGHANTREKRYTSGKSPDPWTLANTVLKMAKKRALVDAVLTVASLSEIFTQDIEDMDIVEAEVEEMATDKQKELIMNLLRNYVQKMPNEDSNSYAIRRADEFQRKYGKRIEELTKKEASRFIDMLSQKKNGEAKEEKSGGSLV